MSIPARRPSPSPVSRLAAALCLMVAVVATPVHGDDGFVEGIDDLPLMPGLQNAPDASVAFDALAGRIVVAFAEGTVTMEDVRAFYGATLPQLGWQRTAQDRWARAGEQLSLDAVVDGNGLVVRFELTPR